MADFEIHSNPFINSLLATLGSITGLFGMTHEQLQTIDLVAALILKIVSILAFSALVIVNWNKVWKLLTKVTKKKDDNKT